MASRCSYFHHYLTENLRNHLNRDFVRISAHMIINSETDWNRFAEGEELSLRGFLYRSEDGQWILSPEPNLRSCCIGTKLKKDTQIALEGQLDESSINKAVTVKGIWSKEPRFQLSHAQIEKNDIASIWWIIPFIMAAGYLFHRIRTRKDRHV